MKITEEQLKILATLKCERLSSDDNNLRLVEEFFNKKESLSNTLKNEAYEDDEAGNTIECEEYQEEADWINKTPPNRVAFLNN